MKLQKLYSYTRKAIDDFQMIKENDSIAVGISGGKRQSYAAICPGSVSYTHLERIQATGFLSSPLTKAPKMELK